MQATYTADGKLAVAIGDLMDALPPDEKLRLVETLSCDDDIIRHVAAQILDGWTENGMCGGVMCQPHGESARNTPLDQARRAVAERAGEVAAEEVRRLASALDYEQRQHRETRERLWQLQAASQGRLHEAEAVMAAQSPAGDYPRPDEDGGL